MEQSIARQVFAALDADPYAKQAIRLRIANYSAIAKRLNIRGASFHAVKAAVRRYAGEMEYHTYEKGLKHILAGTKITLKSNVAVLFLAPGYDSLVRLQKVQKELGKEFSLISSPNGITIILDQEKLGKVKKIVRRKIISELKGMYAIILTSPFEEIDTTPGFVAFVTELLARNAINIHEYYSCYSDTAYVLGKQDALKAYGMLDKVLG